jgi:hypothetical protein
MERGDFKKRFDTAIENEFLHIIYKTGGLNDMIPVSVLKETFISGAWAGVKVMTLLSEEIKRG